MAVVASTSGLLRRLRICRRCPHREKKYVFCRPQDLQIAGLRYPAQHDFSRCGVVLHS